MLMLMPVSVEVPWLERVTPSEALVVPRFWVGNVRLPVLKVASGPTPVPLRLIPCGVL